jgi:uncharacterized protein (DUF2384 family)
MALTDPKNVVTRPVGMAAGAGGSALPRYTPALLSEAEEAMVRRATEVLGVNYVEAWLASEIPSLGNQTPNTLMQTEEGRQRVERVLLKIEHGVY